MFKMAVTGIISVMLFITLQGFVNCDFLANLEDTDVQILKTRLSEEKSKRLLLQHDVDALITKVELLERTVKHDVSDKQLTCVTTKPEVSFSARLQTAQSLTSTQIIVFNNDLHNVGNAYSPVTGVFKAPFPGRYVFSLTLLTPTKGQPVHAQIMKNSKEIGRMFTGDNTADWPHTGSVTIVTTLDDQDEVFAREMEGVSGYIHQDYYCTFSGFLL